MNDSVLKCFSSLPRIRLLNCLSKGKKNVSQLIKVCQLSQSAVSQHLQKLKKLSLVKTEKTGQKVYYSLINKQAAKIANQLLVFLKKYEFSLFSKKHPNF